MGKPAIAVLFAAALGISACATYHDDEGRDGRYGDYRYGGEDYADCDGDRVLDPWLACTEEGREIVRLGFSSERGSSEDKERRANTWFRRHADTDGDCRLTDPEIRTALANSAVFQASQRR